MHTDWMTEPGPGDRIVAAASARSGDPQGMRTFRLHRHEDVTGLTGLGVVAEGVVFSARSWAMHWLSELTSIHAVEDILAIHGHQGRTELIYP